MAEGGITPEERYRQWLSPKRALAAVEARIGDRAEAKLRIIEHLGQGVVSAVAYRMISQTGTLLGPDSDEYARIPRSAWPYGDVTDAFWDTGDIQFRKFGYTGPLVGLVSDGHRECIAVRFDPIGIELLIERVAPVVRPSAPQISRAPPPITPVTARAYPKPPVLQPGSRSIPRYAGPSKPTTPPEQRPARPRANPMTEREIKAWYRGLTKAERTLGVTALWARAKSDHPGRHLPRKLVEQFGEGRGTGHRAKR